MKSSAVGCPVCLGQEVIHFSDTTDVEYFSTTDVYTYKRCLKCESIFLQDPPVDALSTIYPRSYYAIDGPVSTGMSLRRLLELVKGYFDKRLYRTTLKNIPGAKLSCLDVGGGSGWMMNLLRTCDSRITETTVLDLNTESRAIAQRHGHRFLNQPIEQLDTTQKYDFVLMLNLIEHVANPREVLKRIHQALSRGGRCLIKTPNTLSINRALFHKHYWGGLHAPRHWVLFNRTSFAKLAVECGFCIESSKYTQGAPQWVASILGSIEKYRPSVNKIPMHQRSAAAPLTAVFAALDLVLLPLRRTDQMIFVLKKAAQPEKQGA